MEVRIEAFKKIVDAIRSGSYTVEIYCDGVSLTHGEVSVLDANLREGAFSFTLKGTVTRADLIDGHSVTMQITRELDVPGTDRPQFEVTCGRYLIVFTPST